MHITLYDIERESYKESLLHRMDGRIKMLMTLVIIIYVVSLPRLDIVTIERLGILWLYLVALIIVAGLNPVYAAARIAITLPFGLGVSILQPFIRQPFITEFNVLYKLGLGISVTAEGLLFGSVLFAKFMVCVTAVVLLSSTTQMRDMVASARRLGLPSELTLLFSMMIRYLFVFWGMLRRIRTAQKTRCFNIWNKNVPRRWILEQIGYSISSLFLRSYEQGERTYYSMLCRAYSADSQICVVTQKVGASDYMMFSVTLILIGLVQFCI
ncbi:MAG: cobalt ECF transporter T component CbiQ [Methanosarcinales archaeon]|nr:cobalt ECF transporter T component CbiQ [Methanosarcinales archaeon]